MVVYFVRNSWCVHVTSTTRFQYIDRYLKYIPHTGFKEVAYRLVSLFSPIWFHMKDFMARTFRGRQFQFQRVFVSSIDTWYHISVTLDNKAIKFRMHLNKKGDWKITEERLPSLLYSLEGEFEELIQLNEKPPDQNRFGNA